LGVLFPFPLGRIELRISSIDMLFYIDDLRGGVWVIIVRATGAQDSRRILSDITVCDYDTTHLQENPQRLG